jgi:hypothetical protein
MFDSTYLNFSSEIVCPFSAFKSLDPMVKLYVWAYSSSKVNILSGTRIMIYFNSKLLSLASRVVICLPHLCRWKLKINLKERLKVLYQNLLP